MKIYYTTLFENNKGESHQWLAQALKEYTGKDSSELIARMTTGEFGKPEIDGCDPFSISHSGNMWAVMFDSDECGLDIQNHKRINLMNIAERWYHKDEISYLKSLDEEELLVAFYKIWTRREALVKAVGKTIFDNNLPYTLNDTVQFEGQTWKFQDFTMTGAENISVAFCVKEVGPMEIIWLGGANA